MLGMVVSGGVSGGHLNPAVTVAVATIGKFPWWKVDNVLLLIELFVFILRFLTTWQLSTLDHFLPPALSFLSTGMLWSGKSGKPNIERKNVIFTAGTSMTVESIAQFQTQHKYSLHFPLLIFHMLEEYLTSFWGLLFSSSVFVPSLIAGT